MRKDINFRGFAPDLDPRIEGLIIDGVRFVPTQNGFRPMKSPEATGLPALDSECRNAGVMLKTDDSTRIIAGTQTKLYESNSGTSWSDISNGTYTGGSESLWRFAQFGDTTYAVNGVDPMQYSSSGAFADRGGDAPVAEIIESVWPGFLMAFNYNDGTDTPDGWYCSALNNDADWTNSIATQSASGRLTDTPGPIRAGKALGQDVIAYKERSMYIGRYIGPPLIWEWQLIPGDIGAPSQESVVNIETAHIFPGYENFYYFDGSRPVPIGNPLKEWYNDNIEKTYRYKMKSLHDRDNSNVYFFYAESDGTICASLVYNYRADKWGKASLYDGNKLQAAFEYLTGGLSYEGLGSLYTTYDNLPAIPYDSPFWTAATPQPAIFQDDNTLYSLTGTPADQEAQESSIAASYFGDDETYTLVDRVRLKFTEDSKNLANVDLRTTEYVGDSLTSNGPYSFNGNKADMFVSAKWHSPKFTLRGDYEVVGYSLEYEENGTE